MSGAPYIDAPARSLLDFEILFERLPSPYMVIDQDLRYVEANAAYCATVGRTRDELVGRNLFELFPNEGPEGLRLRRSFERVLRSGQTDTIALIPYPIPRSDGGMEMRYWSAAHVPVTDGRGRTYVLQNTVDVTELQRLKTIAYGAEPQRGETDLFVRTRAVEDANRALSEETQGLRDLFLQAPGFMAVLAGEEMTFTLVNAAYQQLIGHRAVVGKPLIEALPEIDGQGFMELLHQVRVAREPFVGEALSVMLQRTPGGALEERFLDFIYQPIVSPAGEAWGVFVQGADVTDRVHAERQQKLLVDELNHRVKNTLATVQAIAAQTLRSTPDPDSFREAFEARIMALSATHNLLTATHWRSAALHDLLRAELVPYGAGRFRIRGDDATLNASQALALGLVFHELTTNAAKYGALSSPAGEIEVSCRVGQGGARLHLEWLERNGPPVGAPTRRGFGSRLIQTSLGSLSGRTQVDYAPEGLRFVLDLPLGEEEAETVELA